MQLSKTGEVAQFIDDDQFGFGQSVDKCGFECVALFWHSVAPGKINPYASADVHTMAHADYVRWNGPDTSTNYKGMTLAQLYADLAYHRFFYRSVPLDLAYIRGWLLYGFPVILAVMEDSVYDYTLKAKPYSWNTAGLSHIILATGISRNGTALLFRDTANVQYPGVARPGPREYDPNRLSLVSATMAVPTFMVSPPANFDPRGGPHVIPNPPPPPKPITPPDINSEWQDAKTERDLWERGNTQAVFNAQWAIPASWIAHLRKGVYLGVPLEPEQTNMVGEIAYHEQAFTASYARWNSHTNAVTWEGPYGAIS